MNDFLFKQMMSQLAGHISKNNIRAILVTPTNEKGVEINYIMPETDEPLTVGEVVVLKANEYDALKSLANKALFS